MTGFFASNICVVKRANGVHNPPGRVMQDLLACQTICTYKSADATRADRPGRVHAVLGGAPSLPLHVACTTPAPRL
jgi:hypothetical protein